MPVERGGKWNEICREQNMVAFPWLESQSMLHSILDLVAALYAAFPLLFWIGAFGSLTVLLVTLTTVSLCRASGQADERTERMAADCREQVR
jgi:hypothetical protein